MSLPVAALSWIPACPRFSLRLIRPLADFGGFAGIGRNDDLVAFRKQPR
jgi:hypothetical protein